MKRRPQKKVLFVYHEDGNSPAVIHNPAHIPARGEIFTIEDRLYYANQVYHDVKRSDGYHHISVMTRHLTDIEQAAFDTTDFVT